MNVGFIYAVASAQAYACTLVRNIYFTGRYKYVGTALISLIEAQVIHLINCSFITRIKFLAISLLGCIFSLSTRFMQNLMT